MEVEAEAAGRGPFSLPEGDQGYSGAWQASALGIGCALEKELEGLLGPRRGGAGAGRTPAKKGNPARVLCSEEIGSRAKDFIRGRLKLDSCIHMCILVSKTPLALLLSCLLCSPLMG